MKYIDIDKAQEMGGLRLVLTAGLPGPWGMAARAVFDLKGIGYTAVAQYPGTSDAALQLWTGQTSAPVAIYERETPRSGWMEILYLAERLAPSPTMIPAVAADRATMFGWLREIAGEQGFAWQRRLMMLAPVMAQLSAPPAMRLMAAKYGFSESAAAQAPAKFLGILQGLAQQLQAQQLQGSPYFIGTELTALDVYWAVFCSMIDPLPHTVNPMPSYLRSIYTLPAVMLADIDPILLTHRDMLYSKHLHLPLDFLID